MKGGTRDPAIVRCRCKVGFDMHNWNAFHPVLNRCHLMHFNDNKYRFQSKRQHHHHDHGNIAEPGPLSFLLSELQQVSNYTEYALSYVHEKN